MCERVSVNVRFRPLNDDEKGKGRGEECCQVSPGNAEVTMGDGKRFTYDHVFPMNAAQDEVYEKVGKPVVASVLSGYNGTVLAYGQTGSGKTYTMTGPDGGRGTHFSEGSDRHSERGLVTRVLHSLFAGLDGMPAAETTWSVTLTIAELFKETLRDLLSGDAAEAKDATTNVQRELRIREDRTSGRGVYIEGIQEHRAESYEEALSVIRTGMERKNIAATGSNETSSRSHTIVTVFVTQVNHVKEDARTVGRLNLVDLAGSERVEKTGAEGDRLKEAQTINLSLTLLGNVIHKLTDGKSVHIPYRDSKLTRILQDSFGGNSRTTLFCNCSSSSLHGSETMSTLMFANRAKQIRNKPRVNRELNGADLKAAYQRAQEEIVQLKIRIATLEEACGGHALPLRRTSSVIPYRPNEPRPAEPRSREASPALPPSTPQQDKAEEMRATLESILKELSETRVELEEAIDAGNQQKERCQFYEKRGQDAAGKTLEWKQRHDREKRAADSWMRKYNDLVKDREKEAAQAAAKKAVPKKSTRSGSVGAKKSVRSGSITRKPQAKAAEATADALAAGMQHRPPTSSSQNSLISSSPSALSPPETAAALEELSELLQEAKASEASLLQRERELQASLDTAEERVAAGATHASELEKRSAEQRVAIIALEAKFESLSAEHDQRCKMQDKEVSNLLLKLDELRGKQQEKEEKEKSSVAGDAEAEAEEALLGGGRQRADQGGMLQLERENQLLYEQNKENAERLVGLTRAKEASDKQVRALQEEKKKLFHQVELSNISAELKSRILGDKLRATKAAFQNRLLQCFSDE